MANELVRKVEKVEVKRIIRIPKGILKYVNRVYEGNKSNLDYCPIIDVRI